MNVEARPIVGLALGDAAGIGPEIAAKALARPEVHAACRVLAIGDARVLSVAAGAELKLQPRRKASEAIFAPGRVEILDLHNLAPDDVPVGQLNARTALAALEWIQAGFQLAEAGEIGALTWAPINKQSLHLVSYADATQEALMKRMTEDENVRRMVQVGPLRIFGVTPHVALREACDLITKDRVLDTIRLAQTTLQRLGFEHPRIVVAALNPHGGEGGLFGREEIEEIGPAVQAAKDEGLAVWGPIPGDTVFVRTKNGEFDAAVAMYHDQTTMPPKLLGFGTGVSMTLAASFPTITTAHGTAFDIAGKGIANPQSLVDAVLMAAQMARG